MFKPDCLCPCTTYADKEGSLRISLQIQGRICVCIPVIHLFAFNSIIIPNTHVRSHYRRSSLNYLVQRVLIPSSARMSMSRKVKVRTVLASPPFRRKLTLRHNHTSKLADGS